MNPTKPLTEADYSDPICREQGHDIRVRNHRVDGTCARCGEASSPVLSTFSEAFESAREQGYDRDSAAALARVSMTFA